VLKIPPVLCVSVFGRIPDVRHTVTADLKKVNSRLVLLGLLDPTGMGGSIYYETLGHLGGRVPAVHLDMLPALFRALYRAIREGYILSAHDVSEGGIGVALAEMCFGGRLGAKIDLAFCGSGRPDMLLFNECAGVFVLEVADDAPLVDMFRGIPWRVFGETQASAEITVSSEGQRLFTAPLGLLRRAWQEPMKELFETVAA
jgi:phosphoribosylformylglycinamidine synthase